jgi:hypothetical protein
VLSFTPTLGQSGVATKGLELIIQFVGKEITLQIVNGYDHEVFLPFYFYIQLSKLK